jgi:hypothetical protein
VFGSAILVGSLVAFHIHLYDATTFLLPIALLVKIGASEWDRYAFVPFFVSPLIFFLMANRFTGFLALATLVLLSSYWRISRFTGNEKYT